MPLEAEAREEIDRQLTACGWAVQDYSALNLTATPSARKIGFCNRIAGPARQAGPAMHCRSPHRRGPVRQTGPTPYTHEKAVTDVYTINTQITAEGAHLAAEPGRFIPHRDRRTKDTVHKELDNNVTYRPGQLDRDVVARDQIRLVSQNSRAHDLFGPNLGTITGELNEALACRE